METVWLFAPGWTTAHEYTRERTAGASSFCGLRRRVALSVAPDDMARCQRCATSVAHRVLTPRVITVHLPSLPEVS